MKILKNTIAIILLVTGINLGAQEIETGTLNSKDKTTFQLNLNNEETSYSVIVYEKRGYTTELDDSDKGKIDQDRLSTPAKVTKMVRTESENPMLDDRFLILTYDKQVTDTFKVSPLVDGFMVTVDKKEVKYVFDEGKYYVDTADKDFFVVQEFGSK
jgi:hypothetical protein